MLCINLLNSLILTVMKSKLLLNRFQLILIMPSSQFVTYKPYNRYAVLNTDLHNIKYYKIVVIVDVTTYKWHLDWADLG